MPIRFRCVKCDSLLSIARRKAGLTIQCPKCQTEVTVPDASTDLAATETDNDENDVVEHIVENGSRGSPPSSIEGLKFEQPQLQGSVNPAHSLNDPSTAPVADVPVEPGLVLSTSTVVMLAVLFLVLLSLSFATGYLIGNSASG